MSPAEAAGLLAHVAATVAMTGLIWFVQLVHYPLFARVGVAEFVAYERDHVRRTARLVGPLMILEVMSAPLLIRAAHPTMSAAWGSVSLLALVWLVTLTLQVPLHRRLEAGWDDAAGRRLVATNWIRTLAWTGRSVLVLAVLATRLR